MMKKYLPCFLLLICCSCLKNSPHLIRYQLSGTSNSYQVSYLNNESDSVSAGAVTNYWRVEFATSVDGTAGLWVRNRNNTGTAIATIFKDDKLAAQDSVGAGDSLNIQLQY